MKTSLSLRLILILTVAILLLFPLTLGCDNGGGGGGDGDSSVLTSVTFSVTNTGDHVDSGNRIMRVTRQDTTDTTYYQFTVVGRDQNGDVMDISGLPISWNITNETKFTFVGASSLDGDDETCEVVALVDDASSTSLTVTVDGISASEAYTLIGLVNVEGQKDVFVNGFYEEVRTLYSTGSSFYWNNNNWPDFDSGSGTISDAGQLTFTINSGAVTLTIYASDMSDGTHDGGGAGTWSAMPN